MHSLLAWLFPFVFPVLARGQDVDVLLREAGRLEAVPNEKAAFAKYRELVKAQPSNIYALNKCSELCSRIGKRERSPAAAQEYYRTAINYANAALKVNPNNSEANCVMAIALGRNSLSKSGKEKIDNAREVKKYVDAAIKNDPQNYKAWHVLGRWHFEICTLNAFERSAARVFYGALPPASLDASIKAFERSQAITDRFVLNYIELAKAYRENRELAKAIATLSRMMAVPDQTEDDPITKTLGKKLLKEWK